MSFHCSVKPISRSAGRSATGAAAYRTGTKIEDERTALVFDYSKKRGVEHSEIILPAGAPGWANDTAALWNHAELAETRKNSTVAREWEVLIPYDLNQDQAKELLRDYCNAIVDRHGIAIQFSLHQDNAQKWDGSLKGREGLHAHCQGSTRRLTPDGFGEKSRELDAKDTGPAEIIRWREEWERLANMHLERAGSPVRIDCRSFLDQGLDLKAMPDLPPSVVEQERRGIATDFGDKVRAIEASNQAVIQTAIDQVQENDRVRDEAFGAISGNVQSARDASQYGSATNRDLSEADRQVERAAEGIKSRRAEDDFESAAREIHGIVGQVVIAGCRVADKIWCFAETLKERAKAAVQNTVTAFGNLFQPAAGHVAKANSTMDRMKQLREELAAKPGHEERRREEKEAMDLRRQAREQAAAAAKTAAAPTQYEPALKPKPVEPPPPPRRKKPPGFSIH